MTLIWYLRKKVLKIKEIFFWPNIHISFQKLIRIFLKKSQLVKGIRGCNMSFYKSDFEGIEGFNEKIYWLGQRR